MGGFRNTNTLFIGLLLALPILFAFNLSVGSVDISFSELWLSIKGEAVKPSHDLILFQSRIPKALTALICGASLSVSGLLMQSLFRNPLAGPYILGISSGAGLGVALVVMGAGVLGLSLATSVTIPLAAVLGSLLVLLILFLVSLRLKDVMTLLILGIMLGSIATAIVGIIQYFTTDFQLKSFLIWTLGSIEGLAYKELLILSLINGIALLAAFLLNKPLNAFLLGEDYAKSLGISIKSSRLLIILISGILAGLITAYCGPIGFVGIIVPHLCRLLFKSSNHRILIPASILMGAEILLLSDLLAQLPGNGIKLPINSVTSIIGIPIILWIIFKKRSISKSF
jgi:iron complex transport system permease protein